MTESASVLIDQQFQLGEGPLWDHDRRRLVWTDIQAGELWDWTPDQGPRRLYTGDQVGGYTFQTDGTLLLFRQRDIAVLDADGNVRSVIPFHDDAAARFNDVIAAPDGSVFAGTIGADDRSGGLYHVSRDGAITMLFDGMKVANGMGFSPDRRTFYFTDSTARVISAWDIDPDTAAISAKRILVNAEDHEHTPDGMTVDAEGHIWSARWGGARVLRHHKDDGREIARVDIDTDNATACAIGGPDGTTMYITSHKGPVYTSPSPVSAPPEFKSAVLID